MADDELRVALSFNISWPTREQCQRSERRADAWMHRKPSQLFNPRDGALLRLACSRLRKADIVSRPTPASSAPMRATTPPRTART